jgi:Glyoxalase superfamily protein
MQLLREVRSLDPKTAAKRLRDALETKNIKLTHGECLDLVSKQLGHKNWNVLSAALEKPEETYQEIQPPYGWVVSGINHRYFEGRKAAGQLGTQQSAFMLQSRVDITEMDPENDFASILQIVNAIPWIGKRLKIACHIKALDVKGAATIWLRFDGASGQSVGFSNLEDRTTDGAIQGTTNWTLREIVADVPSDAVRIAFGFYLRGVGQATFAGFEFSEANASEDLTIKGLWHEPRNLSFSASA